MTSASMIYIRLVAFGVAALLSTSAASAAPLNFQRLTKDRFVVHQATVFGGTKKASRIAHKKAASLCVAAGFSFLKVLDSKEVESEVGGWKMINDIPVAVRTSASSTLLVRFKHRNEEEGEEEHEEGR